jgi:outer membrane protein OmpA-like peptidoglycan-associated protein
MALKRSFVLLFPLLLAVAGGCAGPDVYQERHFDSLAPPEESARIAVPALDSHAEHPGGGAILAALLETELRGRGQVAVVDEPAEADAVVQGVVTEFGYQHGLHEEPVVGVTATLRRNCDHTALWAASHASVGEGYFFRESVAQVAQRLARRLMDDLAARVPPERMVCDAQAPDPVREVDRQVLNIRFDYRSAAIRSEDRPELDRLAENLRAQPRARVLIEGHTDAAGPEDYNRDLSRRRAASVRDYLVGQAGIAAGRVDTVGHGEARPVATNETEAGRARNRRIEAVILLPDGERRTMTGQQPDDTTAEEGGE